MKAVETHELDQPRVPNVSAFKPLTQSNRMGRLKQNIPLLLMFAPVIVFYVVFKYVPMVGILIAFKNYHFIQGIFGSNWVGWKNFQVLFTDPQSLSIIRNTLLLSVLSIGIGFPFPILLAILLNEVHRMWFKRTVQTLVYLPHFLSWVIIGEMILTMFSQQTGALNHWIERLAGHPYPFLYKEMSWIAVYLGSGVWKEAGFTAIIYLAALTTIDPNLYEAAGIDGASKFRQIWHITLPGITTTIVLMVVLSMGHVMEVGFDQVYVLQNPSVSNVSDVISTYIYRVGLQGGQFSLTTAMGLFESVVAFVLVVVSNWIARRFNQGLW